MTIIVDTSVVVEDFQPSIHAQGAITVLLVEDDPAYVEFARLILSEAAGSPIYLRQAATLREAEAILAVTAVSVILLDVHLPDGNGLDWLKAHRARLEAAVVVLTGSPMFDHQSEVVSGAQDLLVKSQVEGDQLTRAVRYAADRESARQQLVRSRQYFQSLIEQARDLITVVDEYGRIVYQSPASADLLGARPDTYVGRCFFDLVDTLDVNTARSMLASIFSGEHDTVRGELHLWHVDGTNRTLEVIASPIPSEEGRRRAVLNSRDITERRRAEEALRIRDEQLRQAQKMEAVGRLAGGIAHDFSNVLTVITAACEKLQDQIGEGKPELGQIETILRNSDRATSLTRQLLAFSRQQTLAPKPVNLGGLVAHTGQLLRQLIGEHIDLRIDVASDLRAIEADPVQIEQVLMNLAINARDAMPKGGWLRVSLRNMEVSDELAATRPPMPPGTYVVLEVTDTGHGMSAETQARAFEPFFTTKDPTRGTGLGLSTAYGIVKQSGGYIWVDSELGHGTTFSVFFPPTQAEPVESRMPARPAAESPARPATILLTEDEEDVRDLLRDMLAAHGYTVIEATGPADALARSATMEGRIDLLLTDVVMPGGTGRDLARTMTAARPDMKVLYMSGYPEHGAAPGSVLEPGVPFIPKPFTRQLLLDQIRAILG